MEEFLNNLYSYEYFGIYLMISIIVLILIFLVILFFGKKDQREREKTATLKLQQINEEAFKEDSIEEKIEVNNLTEDKLENDTIIVPTIEDVPTINNEIEEEIPEPILPVQEEVINNENIVEDIPVINNKEENKEISPLLEKVEEKPLVFNDFNLEEVPDIKLENITPIPVVEEKEELEVPEFNFDEIVKSVEETKKTENYKRGPQIFSSVYIPSQKEETPKIEEPTKKIETTDNLGMDLPSLKKEPVIENNQQQEKQEDKIELPMLNDYNLDELSGETYTINK